MTKSTTGILVAVISVGLIGTIAYTSMNENNKNESKVMQTDMNMAAAESSAENKISNPTSNEIMSGTVEINIQDFNFQPKNIKVRVGTKVTWTNQDTAKHDITPDVDSPDFQASKLLSKGESYSFTFMKPGNYPYHCSPHPYMKAAVEVVE